MSGKPISDEELARTVEFYKKHNENITYAAEAMGLARSSFRDRLIAAARIGLIDRKPVMPGFGIKSVSTQMGPEGETQKEWVKQTPLAEQIFTLPDGHTIKGVSALLDSDGKIIQQWVKTKFEQAARDVANALRESFQEYTGHATLPSPPTHVDTDLATIYPISDHHLGLYTWVGEVGENYDLNIGRKLLMDTMASLVADAPNSETGVVLSLGDFFHSDNNSNRTQRSNNALDVDGRHAKILRVGVELIIHCVQLALQRHKHVIVRCLPGNHDEYASLALSVALSAFFSNNPHVTVDTDASYFFKFRFGKVLICSTHGDMARHTDMPGIVASMWPVDWGETKFRYCYLGHVHHKSFGGGEKAGLIWETFQTLAPKDVWHHQSGYTSGRSMVAITHHQNTGEWKRHTVSVNNN